MIASEFTIGIDLGGTSVRIGLFDSGVHLLTSRTLPTRVEAGPDSFVDEVAATLRAMLHEAGISSRNGGVLGIGIGSPGPINLRSGVLGLLPNLPGWENFPLRDALSEATGLHVTLESDANAAAIAEWKLGAGKDMNVDSMAMLTLGTGVGSGLILGGRMWHGMFGMGGEAGHAMVEPEGLPCGCGSRGCLEMYASANGLLRLARAAAQSEIGTPALRSLLGTPESCTPHQIARLAEEDHDPSALAAFERLGYYVGLGIANLINVLDLPMIVVGGGVAGGWTLFSQAMFRTVREYSVVYRLATPSQLHTREPDRTFIRPALLGPSAGLLGAALLPRLLAEEERLHPTVETIQ